MSILLAFPYKWHYIRMYIKTYVHSYSFGSLHCFFNQSVILSGESLCIIYWFRVYNWNLSYTIDYFTHACQQWWVTKIINWLHQLLTRNASLNWILYQQNYDCSHAKWPCATTIIDVIFISIVRNSVVFPDVSTVDI